MRHPDLERLVESDRTWPYEAYEFVLNSLDFAARAIQDSQGQFHEEDAESNPAGDCHHVDGRQIALAARELAQQEFGQMAPVVFSQWGIGSTSDLGKIIFRLIEVGLLNKNEKDSIADFEGIYAIPEELLHGFQIKIQDF